MYTYARTRLRVYASARVVEAHYPEIMNLGI